MKVLIKIYNRLKQDLNNYGSKEPWSCFAFSLLYAGPKFFNMSNIVTYKIKYQTENQKIINDYIHRFNNLLRCTYNYIFENLSAKNPEILKFQKTLKNIPIECGFLMSSRYKAKELITNEKKTFESINQKRKSKNLKEREHLRKCLFGGKLLYDKYLKGLISKEDFKKQRNFPIYVVGEANVKSNRHFRINDENTIIFKPNKKLNVELKIKLNKNWKKDIQKLHELQENKEIPITYQLDYDYIYITFDLDKIRERQDYKPIENRIFAIDMNPDFIGYSVVDWKDEFSYKIIDSGVVSIKELNDYDNSLKGKGLSSRSKERKYVSNKRNFEVCQIAKFLINQAKHYKCEIFGFEDLKFKQEKSDKSRKFNRLCRNQWNYTKLEKQIIKRCKFESIYSQRVSPEYSSFIGNLIYRNCGLPDMCLASIEISRRAYEFQNQYIKKSKEIKRNIIFPEVNTIKPHIIQALEEIGYIGSIDGLGELCHQIKNMKLKYRVPLTSKKGMVSSLLSVKSYLSLYKIKGVDI